MATFLVICQGIGLAAACGVRPFLPALLAGGLAVGARGLDFDGTDYRFLESPIFLLAAAIGLVVVTVIERRRGAPALGPGALAAAVGGLGIGVGALEFAGSLADEKFLALGWRDDRLVAAIAMDMPGPLASCRARIVAGQSEMIEG